MSIEIIKPGLLTTIQDKGRFGFRKYGIIVSGAMDAVALRIANVLAGNPENEAAIEITMIGPKIRFLENHLIAITGANLTPAIDQNPIQTRRPVYVRKGSLLEFGPSINGCRAYIAVAGGLDIHSIMNSTSTYLRARIGGWHGKALQAGNIITCKAPTRTAQILISQLSSKNNDQSFVQAGWAIDPQLYPEYAGTPFIYAIKGPEYELFSKESQHNFWNSPFLITPQSDRMGYRLKGPALTLNQPVELLSSAVTFGTVQVPSAGNPIVLMADHPTTGGYPRIAQVITADFSKLAQMQPGDTICFKEISLQEAQQLVFRQEENIAQIKRALKIKALNPVYKPPTGI